jgi:hypothetical protein
MNDDYLWDRTGEPDPEIQQLEEVLGTLRYQPQPLKLPAGTRPERQRRYFTPLAIAAAVALLILAAGLWTRIQHVQTPRQRELSKGLPPAAGEKKILTGDNPSPTPSSGDQAVVNNQETSKSRAQTNPHRRKPISTANSFAAKRTRQPSSAVPENQNSIAELEEARAAKEQLMLALRLTSAKLNYAQRKTQGPPMPSTIRNQHKVG